MKHLSWPGVILAALLLAPAARGQQNTGSLTVLGADGGSCTVQVQATYAGPAPVSTATTATLTASPVTISSGQSATLTWSTTNASIGDIEPGVGTVQPSGSVNVTPSQTTTYTLTAYGINEAQASATVTVSAGLVTPGPAPSTLCGSVQWFSLSNADVGGPQGSHSIVFVPTKTGNVGWLKWYNSADSSALRTACSNAYGSIQPCDSTCGAPANRDKAPAKYSKACPKGWRPFADACSANPSGCYSAGAGADFRFTLKEVSTGNVLATAVVKQSTVTYGFAAAYPVIPWSNLALLTAGKSYQIVVDNTAANPKTDWGSLDFYIPYNLLTIAQVGARNLESVTLGGNAGVANAIVLDANGQPEQSGSWANYQPIFALGYADPSGNPTGECIAQGFK